MIIFPMAGLSRRFFSVGYQKPKYMLTYGGKTVFSHVVSGFAEYLGKETLVFTCREDFDTPAFIRQELLASGLGEDDFVVHCLEETTRGQADTVLRTLDHMGATSEPVTIFNVDTIRHGYRRMEDRAPGSKGFLEVVRAEGDHWSFVRPKEAAAPDKGVAEGVVEKARVSELCSTGLYHFEAASLYRALFEHTYITPATPPKVNEQYIAPIYQTGIDQGMIFDYLVLPECSVEFCGTPEEYESLKTKYGV